jgi:hypothetical protein
MLKVSFIIQRERLDQMYHFGLNFIAYSMKRDKLSF